MYLHLWTDQFRRWSGYAQVLICRCIIGHENIDFSDNSGNSDNSFICIYIFESISSEFRRWSGYAQVLICRCILGHENIDFSNNSDNSSICIYIFEPNSSFIYEMWDEHTKYKFSDLANVTGNLLIHSSNKMKIFIHAYLVTFIAFLFPRQSPCRGQVRFI